jgi:hypothetical protein
MAILVFAGSTSGQTPTTTTTAPPAPVAHWVSITAKLKIKLRTGAFVGARKVDGKPFGKGSFRSGSTVQHTHPLKRLKLSDRNRNGVDTMKVKGKITYADAS